MDGSHSLMFHLNLSEHLWEVNWTTQLFFLKFPIVKEFFINQNWKLFIFYTLLSDTSHLVQFSIVHETI